MRLRGHFWILVIFWHLLLGGMAYLLLRENYGFFMLAQVGLVVSLFLAARLIRHFMRPIDLVTGGRAAMQVRDFTVKYRPTGSPEIDALVDVYNEMIDTLRRERTLAEEQHFFLQRLIEASPTGMLILDYDGAVTQVNPSLTHMLGFDPTGAVLSPEQTEHPILRAARSTAVGGSQNVVLDGADHYRIEVRSFVDRGFSRKFVQVQDVSSEVLAAEKRAYGKVIRMMAHEVNNNIGAVNALLQVLSDPDLPSDEEWVADVRESLPIAMQRNERLNTFMRNFADVVRLPPPRLERVELADLVQKTVRLMQPLAAKRDIALRFFAPGKPCYAQIDPYQMEQALVNIIKNALESIDADGQVTLRLAQQPLVLEVADNGPGLNEEAAGKIFSPFFTTKPNGQGVGLTLVRDILANHHIRFSLRTGDDGWTRFRIVF